MNKLQEAEKERASGFVALGEFQLTFRASREAGASAGHPRQYQIELARAAQINRFDWGINEQSILIEQVGVVLN